MNFKIKVKSENLEKIEQAIKAAEGKAKVRTITPQDIISTCQKIEKGLNIPKTNLKGVSTLVNIHRQSFANAYKGIPESTYFSVIYDGKNWELKEIYRNKCNNKYCQLTLTENAKNAIIKKYEQF